MTKIRFVVPYNATKSRLLAPFSQRHATKYQVAQQPLAIQLVARHIVISDDDKLLFVQNSKSGCTSASHLIFEHNNGYTFDGKIHKPAANLKRGLHDWDLTKRLLASPDAYRFTIVRDPIKRAVSAFKDFFVEKQNPASDWFAKPIRAMGYDDSKDIEDNFDVFLDFVTESMRQSATLTDPHFRCQTHNVAWGYIDYNRVCRLENYADEMRAVFTEAGLELPLGGQNLVSKKNTTKSVSFAPSNRQIDRIKTIWADDFRAFDY